MALRLISNIIITQQPSTTYPNRSEVYTLNFVNECEIKSSWENLTATAKLVLPKNVYVNTQTGKTNWSQQDIYANTTGIKSPVLMKGDRISINLGYYYNSGGGAPIAQMNEEFNGFITKVNPKIPMEIECEDNMWLLKQAMCPNMVFTAGKSTATYKNSAGVMQTIDSYDGKSWSVQSIINALLNNIVVSTDAKSSGYVYLTKVIVPALQQMIVINGIGSSENTPISLGNFTTMNDTICSVLLKLQRDYKLNSFFRPHTVNGKVTNWNNLYCSMIVYYPQDYINTNTNTFTVTAYNFQQNIIDGTNLIYLRTDDVRLGIAAYTVGQYPAPGTNSLGNPKTKQQRFDISVGDTDGEVRTQFFWPLTGTDPIIDQLALKVQANQLLTKLKYEGWRGNFTSFGLPYVQHGQAVELIDTDIPERTGSYLVKSTEVKFGMSGFRRTIEPHIRIDSTNSGLQISEMLNGL